MFSNLMAQQPTLMYKIVEQQSGKSTVLTLNENTKHSSSQFAQFTPQVTRKIWYKARLLPVLAAHRHLLGMSWKGSFYIDLALPFGLSSAPRIFTRDHRSSDLHTKRTFKLPQKAIRVDLIFLRNEASCHQFSKAGPDYSFQRG